MHGIIKLIDWIDDEIRMAEKYAEAAEECAEMKKTSHATTFAEIAKQELSHYERLHRMLIDKIDSYTSDKDKYEVIKQMYDYHHKEQMERVAEVRYMLEETAKF